MATALARKPATKLAQKKACLATACNGQCCKAADFAGIPGIPGRGVPYPLCSQLSGSLDYALSVAGWSADFRGFGFRGS